MKEDMKILIVALDFKPLLGGVAEYTHRLASGLALLGNDITVLSKNIHKREDLRFDKACPYRVIRFDYDDFGRFFRQYKLYKEIAAVVKDEGADIIICNSLGSDAHICSIFSKVSRIPYILLTHGMEINTEHGVAGKIKKAVSLRGAGGVVSVSRFTQKLVLESGVSLKRTAVIPPSLSPSFIKEAGRVSQDGLKGKLSLGGKRVIFTLGRLIERKGLDSLIKAMEHIRKKIPNAVLVISGEGGRRNILENLVKDKGLSGAVVFTGYLSRKEKHEYYKACDVFAMVSKELPSGDVEGFGIVYLEAGVHGKPVVAGRSGGVSDAVVDGKTGFLVDPFDIEKIASAIVSLLGNSDLARKMGENGRLRARKEFLQDRMGALAQDFLKSLL